VALWEFSVTSLPEVEDALSHWLEATFGQPASSYFAEERGTNTISVFLSEKPNWDRARKRDFREIIQRLKNSGLKVGSARVRLRRIKSQDWAESWKKHFKPIEIGRALLIQPGWSKRKPCAGQAAVVLDPGLSFGTGQHPTTRFCLEQLLRNRATHQRQSFLDMGTGSGILAISAAKLGYAPINAIDYDPEAVPIACRNAMRNRVGRKIKFAQEDITKWKVRARFKYSIICANLISTLLLNERERILSRLESDGVLVLAGILRKEFAAIQRAYQKAGMTMIASRAEKEWRSGAFRFA
jgi:ribosomal protein L11 methyltransferase